MKRYSRVFIFAYCLIILFSSIFCRKEESSLFSLTVSFSGVKYIGPYSEATNLVYEHAFTNIGNAYDYNTGRLYHNIAQINS